MLLASLLLLIMVIPLPQAPSCADMSTCRTAALEAQARKEFETFHDRAWLAYRKGRADDPELMLLLARAQSLSSAELVAEVDEGTPQAVIRPPRTGKPLANCHLHA